MSCAPDPGPGPSAADLDQLKLQSTLHWLFKAARLANEHALRALRRPPEARALGPAHLALFAHIDWEGTRQSTIARRAGVTKQAIHPLIDDLERAGVVERRADPADGRAKLVTFTARGREQMAFGLRHLIALERSIDAELGEPPLSDLKPRLQALVQWLAEQR